MVAIVDEDSSSINSSNSKNEMKENVILDSAEKKIKDVEKNHIECDLSNKNANDNASDINYIENQVKPDVIDVSLMISFIIYNLKQYFLFEFLEI